MQEVYKKASRKTLSANLNRKEIFFLDEGAKLNKLNTLNKTNWTN